MNQAFIDGLIRESEKNIWLVGGGELIRSFMNLNAVDELILSFISRIIGDGLPLFPSPMRDSTWRLTESEMINEAAVILTYRRPEPVVRYSVIFTSYEDKNDRHRNRNNLAGTGNCHIPGHHIQSTVRKHSL